MVIVPVLRILPAFTWFPVKEDPEKATAGLARRATRARTTEKDFIMVDLCASSGNGPSKLDELSSVMRLLLRGPPTDVSPVASGRESLVAVASARAKTC